VKSCHDKTINSVKKCSEIFLGNISVMLNAC